MAVTSVLLLLVALVRLCYSLPTGAPPAACSTLTPRFPHAPGMSTRTPYRLTVAGITEVNGSYYYAPGQTYTGITNEFSRSRTVELTVLIVTWHAMQLKFVLLAVTLRGSSGEQFRGFLMQIRSAADQSILTGLSENSSDIRSHSCSPAGGGVTHTNRNNKTSVQFQWTPTAGTGDVVFR